jgi:hypothetical protein
VRDTHKNITALMTVVLDLVLFETDRMVTVKPLLWNFLCKPIDMQEV